MTVNRPVRPEAQEREVLREMTFLEHLEELRGVLIHAFFGVLIPSMVAWFFSGRLVDMLITDLAGQNLNFFAPSEAFMVRMKVSFVVGAMAAAPYILYRVWAFVSPALFERERRRILPVAIASTFLFYAGVVFCYLVLIPVIMQFLLGFGTARMNPVISVRAYFALVARMCFTFGAVFQLPIVVLLLSLMGLVSPQLLLAQWRWAITAIFVIAAVLTPPDPVSQVFMAVPLVVLYIGSVLVSVVAVRRRRDDEEVTEADGSSA